MSSGSLPMATYHRTKALGEGSFGSVLTVYNDDGEEYALKLFLEDDNDNNDETLEVGALREISFLRLLRDTNGHSNIVELVDVRGAEGDEEEDEDELGAGTAGCLAMAMPLYKHGSLDQAIDAQQVTSKHAKLAITHGLLSALTYLHDNGIMHRDIKSENVMLSHDDNGDMKPILIDFSLAKLVNGTIYGQPNNTFLSLSQQEPTTHTGQAGTATYMAPEVYEGEIYDTQADVWSLGVVLLEVLQKKTMEGVKATQAFGLVEQGLGQLPTDKPLPTLVRNLLVPDPSARWTARQALQEMSTTLFSNLPVPARKIIDMKQALPLDHEASDDEEENVAPPKPGKTPRKPKINPRLKKIKQLCRELEAEHPLTISAAFSYATCLAELEDEIDDLTETQALLDCVVAAHKVWEVEMLDLETLAEDYASFKNWDLDQYRDNEATLFLMMDHCLLPRALVDDI